MEFFPQSPVDSEILHNGQFEILFFLPNLEMIVPYLPCLLAKKDCAVKILVQSPLKKSHLLQDLQSVNMEVKSVSKVPFSLRKNTAQNHICIIDRKIAFFGHEIFSENSSVAIRGADAEVLADYFQHYWNKLSIFKPAISYLVRNKKFCFSTGKRSLHMFLTNISNAQSEVYVAIPHVNKRLAKALLEARRRGASVCLLTSMPTQFSQWQRARNRSLAQAGVKFVFTANPSPGFLALIDSHISFFGNAPTKGKGSACTSFGFFDPQINEQLSKILREKEFSISSL